MNCIVISIPEPVQAYGGYTERCNLPVRVGSCDAAIPSYFFNVETQSCQNFTYGGCFGNANRFQTLEECERACKESQQDNTFHSTENPISARSGSGSRRLTTAIPVIPNFVAGGRRERPTIPSIEDQVQDDKGK